MQESGAFGNCGCCAKAAALVATVITAAVLSTDTVIAAALLRADRERDQVLFFVIWCIVLLFVCGIEAI